MIATMLFALADMSPDTSLTFEEYFLASATRVAAGRACMPVGLGSATASEVTVAFSPPPCSACPTAFFRTTVAATSSPACFRP